jgi:hypothetical protein
MTVIVSLLLTIFIEALIVCGFASWRKKPAGRILAASVLANALTQSLLWGALNLFPGHYLIVLFVMEFFIWPLEGVLLHYFPASRLDWREALSLSLGMNLASFGIGWFLPI